METMNTMRLPPLMSDDMARMFIRQQVDIIREEVRREIEQEKLPLNQKELMDMFGFDAKYLKYLLSLGLKRRKQGRDGSMTLLTFMKYLNLRKSILSAISRRNEQGVFSLIISQNGEKNE